MKKLILILSGKTLPLSLFIRVFLRSKVSMEFFYKAHIYSLHNAGISVWEKGELRVEGGGVGRFFLSFLPVGQGTYGQWLLLTSPGSSIQKPSQVSPSFL